MKTEPHGFGPNEFGLHIIVSGNPIDGFHFYGPFNNGVEAVEKASAWDTNSGQDWWIAKLSSLEENNL